MAYKNVHNLKPDGRLLFRYDAERSLIEIKTEPFGWVVVDLLKYHEQPAPQPEPQSTAPEAAQPEPVAPDVTPAE